MSYLKHNIKRKKKAKGRVRKRGKEGRKKEAQCVHISLAWRFAEVCTPLEPAVSLANDTSGASLGNGVRRAPGFHISSTRYFGIRKRGLWGTSFQELIGLFLSVSLLLPLSSPIGFTPLLFLLVVVLLHTQTFSVSLSFSLLLSSYLPSFLSLSYFLIW